MILFRERIGNPVISLYDRVHHYRQESRQGHTEAEDQREIEMIKKMFSGLEEFVFPEGSDIQAEAFNILAVCGIIVSMLTALFNLRLRFGTVSVLGCLSGAFFSLGMILYTRRTGHYRSATVLTVLVIFLGLFTFLFFKNGGYEGGVPYFFVFAAVFTAFLLDLSLIHI